MRIPAADTAAAGADGVDAEEASARYKGKGKKKQKSDRKDLYALLGLENERFMATDAQLK